MGTVFKALEKLKNRINDIPEIHDDIGISEFEPNSIREDNTQLSQNHSSFPEEYIRKV